MSRTYRIYIGTVISGTLRYQDLIPAFMAELCRINPEGDLSYINPNSPGYYATDSAEYDCEMLFDTLQAYAPDGYYFGANCGDGSDFGFWPGEDAEQDGDVPEYIVVVAAA